MRKAKWGILGTGMMARKFAHAVRESKTGTLVAVGSRFHASALRFADEYQVAHHYGTYAELVADPEVQVIYVALPNHLHAEWTVRSAEAGKHILCEKPLAINHAEAMAVIEVVRSCRVFLMEAFMYRCHPQTARLIELLRSGVIGELRVVEASFGYNMGPKLENIRLQNKAAGGAIMDVGCYCMSMARLMVGATTGAESAEPLEIKGTAHIGGESGVDEYATASLKFPRGVVANLACGTQVAMESTLRLYGSDGRICVPNPWFPGANAADAQIIISRDDGEAEVVSAAATVGIYSLEADTVARHLASRAAPSPCMTWSDSIMNMRALDLWRSSVGLVFEAEQFTTAVPAIKLSRPIRRSKQRMRFGRIDGVDKPVAKLVLGTMFEGATERSTHAMRLLDFYFENGGNALDTAYVYGSERYVGKWIRERNVRRELVLIVKGAASTSCTPEMVDRELAESLERLGSETTEIYLMHRDNLQVPVGEFVDCLNRHRAAGRVQSFGGSNWTLDRVAEANAYAKKQGLVGFTAISNNLSLARMVDPVWPGCISVSDWRSRLWLNRQHIANFAWSSQARGFFSGGAAPDNTSDPELVRCWYSEDNFRRLERVKVLAKKLGVLPINVAAAYVLHQPFPSFALVGPRSLSELRTSLEALNLLLSPRQLRWLNLE